MLSIQSFTFNPFQENTYILFDESKDCVIIDPGCYTAQERTELISFIENNGLNPLKLLNTHCHIDHVLGNSFISDKYKLELEINQLDLPTLIATTVYGPTMGIFMDKSPEPTAFLEEGDVVKFGNTALDVLFTPGHSPGSICFYDKETQTVIAGDVLFQGSIGRTDLPGGNFDTLINSIRQKLFTLDDRVKVYPGHGPPTGIGFEKKHNPFLT